MIPFAGRLKDYFTRQPLPPALFQVSSGYLAGLAYSCKERRITQTALIPLAQGTVEPSFDKGNIRQPGLLAETVMEAAKGLRVSDGDISLLIPDLSFRVFLLSLDSLPPSRSELESLIRWKVKKQMPLLPEDVRISYEVVNLDKPRRLLVLMARSAVIREYESFFAKMRMNVRIVSLPSLLVMRPGKADRPADILLGNVEDDHLALSVFMDSRLFLYRTKALNLEGGEGSGRIAMEVENTLRFVEDHEKKKIAAVSLRMGLWEGNDELHQRLVDLLPLPVERIVADGTPQLNAREREMLAPLIGQVP